MSARTFVAPGKVVLLGEYAVLDGAPALVAAVEPGVRCIASPWGVQIVTTPSNDDRFVVAALHAAEAPPAIYAFEDHLPPPTDTKPGFGGSAAATVVATLAARCLRDEAVDPGDLYERAAAVHHAVQGSGSGIDVAASVYGGVLTFTRGRTTPVDLAVEPVVVWSGRSAHTGPRVKTYLTWSDRADFVERSARIVAAFAADPVGAMRSGRRLLEDMAGSAGLDYRSPTLDRIADLAEEHGGGAKPSGAGGGDCAVAVFADTADRRAFVARCAAEGLTVIPAPLAPGAREIR